MMRMTRIDCKDNVSIYLKLGDDYDYQMLLMMPMMIKMLHLLWWQVQGQYYDDKKLL